MEETQKPLLAYQRKRLLRSKNRHVTIEQVCDMDNIRLAERKARKGKGSHIGVIIFDRNPEQNYSFLQSTMLDGSFRTSEGVDCLTKCPCGKERVLHKVPYFPDHMMHHSLMRVVNPVLHKSYFYDSFASVKGKGMHFAAKRIERYIDENKDAPRLYYCKIDFVKFYPNISQVKIEQSLFRKFTDRGIRHLIHEIVTACDEGLGIGLYPIQPFANFYTGDLCREVMRRYDVRLFVYCDDFAVIGRNKKEVWRAVNFIRGYANTEMEQDIHDNISVQIIDSHHFLDMVGYRFFYGHTLLRKRMKEKFKRKMYRIKDPLRRYEVATAYKGWLMHCNGFNLWKSVMNMKSFKELKVPTFERKDSNGKRMLDGTRLSASLLCDHEIIFNDVELDVKSKYKKPSAVVQVMDNGKKFKFFTANPRLIETLRYIQTHDGFPFKGTLVRANPGGGYPDFEIQ